MYINYYENELFASLDVIDYPMELTSKWTKGNWYDIETISIITAPPIVITSNSYSGSTGIQVAITQDKKLKGRVITQDLAIGTKINLNCSLIWRI